MQLTSHTIQVTHPISLGIARPHSKLGIIKHLQREQMMFMTKMSYCVLNSVSKLTSTPKPETESTLQNNKNHIFLKHEVTCT